MMWKHSPQNAQICNMLTYRTYIMHARLLLPFITAAALATPAFAEDVSVWRLFIADHAKPTVTAIDLTIGDAIGTFPVASPASLYATNSGAAVFAVQGDGNQISAIGSGVALDDH